jgi:phage FluMu gp28-like protein
MTTGSDEFDSRIHDLAERENECDGLFEEIKNGNGEQSVHYITLRDSCKELRKGIFRSAMSAGLTRERINTEIEKARKLDLH